MNRFHKDRPDPCSLCSINIRKQLISYKDRPVKIDSDHLAGFFIIFLQPVYGRFSYKIPPPTALVKGTSTRGFLVIGYKAVSKPESPQLFKQFLCPVICRCTVGNNGIIDIKEQPSVSFSVKLLIIDPIRRIQIFIRKKHLNIYSTSVLSYRSQRGIYSASGRTFLYAGRMILSTLISSSIRCALHPTIRAMANIGVYSSSGRSSML